MRRGDPRIITIYTPSYVPSPPPSWRQWSELAVAEMPGQGALAPAGSESSPIDDADARERFLQLARAE